jgi:aryl-alcohol dehydrogenase-like predicted oxidoreductase
MNIENKGVTRRDFVVSVAGSAAALGVTAALGRIGSAADTPPTTQPMPTRPLGQTGHRVGLFSLGGQGLLERGGHTDEAVAIINRAIDLGVNYLDTAALYGGGVSETYLGQVLKTRRKEVYLATKTIHRDYDNAMRDLEKSLKQLQTDHIDCWQLHTVHAQDVDKIFASNGALKAFEKARDQKITRFLGITGHREPFILKKCIERFPFDSILMAVNAADKHMPNNENEASMIENLLPLAVEKKMAIIGMKVTAAGRIFKPDGLTTMQQAMNYVLSLPISTAIIGISKLSEVEENARIARDFKPMSPEEMTKVETLTRSYAIDATWFKRARGY